MTYSGTYTEKECTKCGNVKPLEFFCAARLGRLGRSAECNTCKSDRYRAAKAANPEKQRERNERWRKNNREKVREISRKSYHKNKDKPANIIARKEKSRKASLRLNYGITELEYENMFEAQNGLCKCCNAHQSEKSRRLAVDHCHSSGKIRGLLCDNCNIAIGMVKENQETLLNMVKYLKESQ